MDVLPRSPAPPRTTACSTGWEAVRATWTDRSRWEGLAVGAVPPLVFVGVSAGVSLRAAVVTAVVVSLAGAGYRVLRHDGLRASLVGFLVTAVCAAVAVATGQARGFFLLPAAVPFAVIAVCLVTLVVGRPLTGLVLNRVSGGPPDWWAHPRLLRVHRAATGVCVGVNVVNAVVQVVFYSAGNTLVLAAAHIATGPVFATIVAVTLVAARRVVGAERPGPETAP